MQEEHEKPTVGRCVLRSSSIVVRFVLMAWFVGVGWGFPNIAHGEGEPAQKAPANVAAGPVVIIPLEGMIEPLLGEFLKRRLADAADIRPATVVFDIDSPGGFLHTMDEMIQEIERFPGAKTVAYIRREALSAAAIIALACDEIIVEKDARFGDAGPIVLGDDSAFRYAPAKLQSDLVARVRLLASRHNRPAALAEAMVDKDAVVFSAIETTTGKRAFFTEAEWESKVDRDQWERGLPIHESRKDKFLEVTGDRAVELGLANRLVASEREMLTAIGCEANPVRFEHTWVDGTVTILSSPLITFLLIVIGVIGLLVELSAPGFGVGGVTSLICFGLFFWSRFLGGTAGWLEVILLLLGAGLIAAEFFVLPGFGVAGISGVVLMGAAILMAMRHQLMPESTRDVGMLGQQVLTLFACCVAVTVVALLSGKYIANSPIVKRFTLAPPTVGQVSTVQTAMSEGLVSRNGRSLDDLAIGELGYAESPLRPGGRARFGDLLVDVLTEGEYVEPRTPVRVVSRSGLRVVVRVG